MMRSGIDIAEAAGTYTTPDGRKLYKFAVTMNDGTDGLAFAETKQPWWLAYPGAVFYEVANVVAGRNHFKIRRENIQPRTPGRRPNRNNWEWALATAAIIVPKPDVHSMQSPPAQYFADLETMARQLDLTLERLKQTTT